MINKVILVGNLGKDPELTYTPSGVAVCKVSLATTERYTDREGQKQESTEWHNLVFWRRQAEIANEYLRKGSQVYVEGSIKYRSWEDRDGNKRYMTDIQVQNFQILGRREGGGGGGGGGGSETARSSSMSSGGAQKSKATPAQKSGGSQVDDGPRYEPIPPPDDSFGKTDDDLPF